MSRQPTATNVHYYLKNRQNGEYDCLKESIGSKGMLFSSRDSICFRRISLQRNFHLGKGPAGRMNDCDVRYSSGNGDHVEDDTWERHDEIVGEEAVHLS